MTGSLPAAIVDRVPELHRLLLEQANPSIGRRDIEAHVRQHLPLSGPAEVAALSDLLGEHLHGFGPLDGLLADPTVSEIMVNGPGPVWVERHGALEVTDVHLDASAIRLVIDRITGPLGLRLDRVVPFVDARLADGSRVHVTVPPMAIDGPYLTIRRFGAETFPLESFGSPLAVGLLGEAVQARRNVLVTGATGAGKTSLLNSLGQLIGSGGGDERIVTIEDSCELAVPGAHVVRLEARPPNAEGVGEITMRTLVRNALRMRPDRIIVGEVRGPEAYEMVQALSTGHAGSLSTCHANGPTHAIDRLVAMMLMADVPLREDLARRMVEACIDLVVHVARAASGRRQIRAIVGIEPGEQRTLFEESGEPVGLCGCGERGQGGGCGGCAETCGCGGCLGCGECAERGQGGGCGECAGTAGYGGCLGCGELGQSDGPGGGAARGRP